MNNEDNYIWKIAISIIYKKSNDSISGLAMEIYQRHRGDYIWVRVCDKVSNKLSCFLILPHAEVSDLILLEKWVVIVGKKN